MIFEFLEKFEKFRREEINEKSRTEAIGWAGLFNGFRDKNSSTPPAEPSDFLPFQEKSDKDQPRSLTKKTAYVLKKLIKENAVPPHVESFVRQIPEMKELLKNGNDRR